MDQQQQQQEMEAVFQGVDFVRLRRGRAYAHAAEDGRSVRLDPRRASHNAVWAVTPRFCPTTATYCVLLRGAYGRYLGAPDATARDSLCCPCSAAPPCRAAAQRDFDSPEILAILWRVVPTSRQGTFLLQDASGRYLRANPRCLCLLPCRCRPGVSVSTCRGLGKATQWAVETVPRGRRPDNPIARDSLFARVCPPLSSLYVRWFSEREIRYVDADDGTGVIREDRWLSTRYAGRTTAHLKRHLVNLLVPRLIAKFTLCIRAGLYGEPTPLAVNLPRSREKLDIVLFEYAESVDDLFIYPDVDAVAEVAAPARDEPVP
uniref:Uncharacterized protein n=1 Tax=Avena sativa TaxID=4498 RepID=A0ACD5VAK8_AVESA